MFERLTDSQRSSEEKAQCFCAHMALFQRNIHQLDVIALVACNQLKSSRLVNKESDLRIFSVQENENEGMVPSFFFSHFCIFNGLQIPNVLHSSL